MNYLLPFVAVIAGFGDIANAFTCSQQGVFKNTDTNDCKSYVVCNSNLQELVQNCPDNTYYWPAGNGCYSNYNCASDSIFGNKNPCEGFDYQYVPDNSVEDCSKYLYCSSTNVYNNGYSATLKLVQATTCPSGTIFSPSYSGCVDASSYHCSNYPCTTEGSFENSNANSCSSFIACSKKNSNMWLSTNSYLYAEVKTCPSGTKYSPFAKKCDAFYNCDGIDEYNGADPCVEFNYANPFVPNPFDIQATSYIECSIEPSGVNFVTILRKDCPANYFFSPLLGKCYDNYDPNETCSKDPCSSGNGRYADYKSGMCDNFVECRDESTDIRLYEPVYEKIYCTPDRRYSPELKKCSKQYVCPTIPANYCYPQIPTTTTSTTTTTAAAAG